jgi:transcriptional regulator with XRE-family HTH domain
LNVSDEKPSLFDQISSQRLQEDLKRHQPEETVRRVLGTLKKDRDRMVLVKREALFGEQKRTLEEIGQELGITRERVRQIEKSARGRLSRPEVADHLAPSKMLVISVLRSRGGLMHEDHLLEELGATEGERRAALRFLLGLLEGVTPLSNDQLGPAWHESHLDSAALHSAAADLRSLLETESRPVPVDTLIRRYQETPSYLSVREKVNTPILEHLLHVSREIVVTEEGEVGLRHWREVNPRSIRDKTYLILRASGAPMHFTEIAQALQNSRWQKRPVTRQAVHNELIRDPRFVLIGRGIYGLSEWGHKPGTVSEVITRVLKEAGEPLHKDEIIRRVLKERIVKEATIVLNLQEKTRFVRVKKATYDLARG